VCNRVPLAIRYEVARCDGDQSWILGLVEPQATLREPARPPPTTSDAALTQHSPDSAATDRASATRTK
jgi:hypothetical protein